MYRLIKGMFVIASGNLGVLAILCQSTKFKLSEFVCRQLSTGGGVAIIYYGKSATQTLELNQVVDKCLVDARVKPQRRKSNLPVNNDIVCNNLNRY